MTELGLRLRGAIRFRPTLWPTVFTVPAVLVMLALGTWQVERLLWKEALIAQRVERTAAPAVPLPGAGDDLAAVEYRRAVVTGEFLHDREMYLAARSLRGNPGYHVVTPLRLSDGRAVLVDRGWVPMDRKDPARRAAGQMVGPVTLDGVIRRAGAPGWLVPDNKPADNVWFWVDPPAMAAQAGVAEAAAPVYLEAGSAENPGGFPIGGQTRINLPNDHLQYAITWYALAAALLVIYVLYHRRREADAKNA
ncbi:MAG: SURF1 family protein [Dongiaceae bacterium]